MIRTGLFLIPSFVCLTIIGESKLHAISPRPVSELELAKSPTIVVAKWEQMAVEEITLRTQKNRFRNKTKLKVLRTVKGPESVNGEVDVLLGSEIGWQANGKFLSSATSTEFLGDVEDITIPCLWFLEKNKAFDPSLQDEFLSIDSYRKIQPLELEAYYLALASDQPEVVVPQLMNPDNPLLTSRVLQYVSGGRRAWPRYRLDLGNFNERENSRKTLRDEASRVWQIVMSDAQALRPKATNAYAVLKDAECITDVRSLLADPNPQVRGTAIGILAHFHDVDSLGHFEKAIQGVNDNFLLCSIIAQLTDWSDDRVIPALIRCLQVGSGRAEIGIADQIPAISARKSLNDMTGCWFPFDVSKSVEAWDKANVAKTRNERNVLFLELLPGTEFPLTAELVGEPISAPDKNDKSNRISVNVRIQNTSRQPVKVTRQPSRAHFEWPGASSSITDASHVGDIPIAGFVSLAPNESLDFQVSASPSFLNAERSKRKFEIDYASFGEKIDSEQWVGTLVVQPGSLWNEVRLIKNIENTWDNGNLKESGMNVNGEKTGPWHFFNEQGDRIRIEHFSDGGGTSICNPEHPANKAAGKRQK
ncbi:MAG: hypothetical protein ABL921_04280 [Pirellula sp.]